MRLLERLRKLPDGTQSVIVLGGLALTVAAIVAVMSLLT